MEYFDIDGNPTTLEKLVTEKPAWACNRIRADSERIAELINIILEAPHHEDCALLIWESGTPRSPCDCWKRKALEDG